MDNVELFIRRNWRGCEQEEMIPNPYPPEPYIDTRRIVEENCGIKRDLKYEPERILIGRLEPQFMDLSYFFCPYVPNVKNEKETKTS